MKLADLKKISDDLGLHPTPTRNRRNKETGESYKD